MLKSSNSQTCIERVILESEQSFGDCQHILYVNGEVKDGSSTSYLMEDFMNEDYRTMHISELAEVVKYYKTTEKGRERMNELQMNLIQRKTAEARDEGILQNQNDIVARMIGKNFSEENISDITGITLERVKEIVNCIKSSE